MAKMGFGKFEDKEIGWVIIEQPGYISWLSGKGGLSAEIRKYIAAFDAKPIVRKCMSCDNPATRLSLYKHIYNGDYYFCDSCSPYGQGAMQGTLTLINTYSHALAFPSYSKEIIKSLAAAKDVPRVKTATSLKNFFGF